MANCNEVIPSINNYWVRLSMIARIIKAEVCVICRSRRLRRITQTEALIILAIMRKANPIIVLLYIYLSKCSMCSLTVGRQTTYSWLTVLVKIVGQLSVTCWPTDDRQLDDSGKGELFFTITCIFTYRLTVLLSYC